MTDLTDSADRLIGRDAVDNDGSKIGTVADVYVDNETGRPEWLAITTGLFGTKVSFVPLQGAELSDDLVVLPYDKSLVKDAPSAEADGQLSPDEEDALYTHYGRSTSTDVAGVDRTAGRGVERGVGYDTSGPKTDDAMTRSEEELDVQTRTREAGRARLRKWIETEDVNIRVPVRKEKVRLVTEPITDANVDAAMSGDDLTTEEHEVVLSEEVVDVEKRVVPKERVRLETDVDTDEVTVDDEVRKERIELDHDVDPDRPTR
jgi:stress response protein YsnF/sporulation protein YlmC with PRC-barrel domain